MFTFSLLKIYIYNVIRFFFLIYITPEFNSSLFSNKLSIF